MDLINVRHDDCQSSVIQETLIQICQKKNLHIEKNNPGWPFLATISKKHIWSHTGHAKFSYMILLWLLRSPNMILIWHPRIQYGHLCVLSTPIQSLCSSSSFKRFTRLMAYWYHIWFLHGPYMVLIWSIYGSYMVHIWFLNVSYMVPACFLHGYYIVHSSSLQQSLWLVTWWLHDPYMVLTCFFDGSYLAPTCFLHDPNMVHNRLLQQNFCD